EFPLYVCLKHLAHSAPRRSQGHGDMDLVGAVVLGNFTGIYKPEIDDIHWNFRIVDCPELIPHQLVTEFGGRRRWSGRKAQRIGVFCVDAHKLSVASGDRVAAPELLRDNNRRSCGQSVNVATGNLGGGTVAS